MRLNGVNALLRAMDRVQRQVAFGTAVGLTRTAQEAGRGVERRIGQAFDRPTSFTRRAVFVQPARRERPVAAVGIKNAQARYLELQEYGGERRPARRALVVPSQVRRNAYGNLPRGAVRRLLARADTFSGKPRGRGSAAAGIWQRVGPGAARGKGGRRIQLLVAYAPRARYRPRFGFGDTVIGVWRRVGAKTISAEVARALATAR